MPTMANITVKKADGTTDVVYTGVVGSSGDRTPALWVNQTVGTMPAERPSLSLQTRSNSAGSSRRTDINFAWPTTSQDAGANKIVDGRASFSGTFLIPQNQPSAVIKEQVYQICNLLASALIKQSLEDGFAPR